MHMVTEKILMVFEREMMGVNYMAKVTSWRYCCCNTIQPFSEIPTAFPYLLFHELQASANSQISFRLLGPFQWFLAFQQVYKTRQVIKYKKDDKSYTVISIRLK